MNCSFFILILFNRAAIIFPEVGLLVQSYSLIVQLNRKSLPVKRNIDRHLFRCIPFGLINTNKEGELSIGPAIVLCILCEYNFQLLCRTVIMRIGHNLTGIIFNFRIFTYGCQTARKLNNGIVPIIYRLSAYCELNLQRKIGVGINLCVFIDWITIQCHPNILNHIRSFNPCPHEACCSRHSQNICRICGVG